MQLRWVRCRLPLLLLACLLALSPLLSISKVHSQPMSLEAQLARYYHILEEFQLLEEETVSELVNLEFKMANERRVIALLQLQMEQLDAELPALEQELAGALTVYHEIRSSTSQALRVMQRLGPASYLEVLSGASSLREFIRRVNAALLLVRGTMNLLYQLFEQQSHLVLQRDQLADFRQQQETLYLQSRQRLGEWEQLHDEKEAVLIQLGERRAQYEQALVHTETAWLEETLTLLEQLHSGFQVAMDGVELPLPGVDVVSVAGGVKIIVPVEALNVVLRQTPQLADVVFVLQNERAELIIPGRLLALRGTLELAGGARIRLRIEEISVAGVLLNAEVRDQLLADVDMTLDFVALTTGIRLRSIDTSTDYVILNATPLIPFIF